MWLMAIVLTVGGLAMVEFASRGLRETRHPDLGWMSQHWLAQFKTGNHAR
jgi:hypothetical protein